VIADLRNLPEAAREQAATLLVHEFDAPRGWPNIELAREEVAYVLRGGFAFGLTDADVLLGWVGGLPEYAGRVWELHPMVVRREHRRREMAASLRRHSKRKPVNEAD
jgi:aminoglycoside 6'-N-acetyltransferase I